MLYYHILLPGHIMPCSVHRKIVFSVLKTYRAWQSVFTWTVQMRLSSVLTEQMGNTGENSVSLLHF